MDGYTEVTSTDQGNAIVDEAPEKGEGERQIHIYRLLSRALDDSDTGRGEDELEQPRKEEYSWWW